MYLTSRLGYWWCPKNRQTLLIQRESPLDYQGDHDEALTEIVGLIEVGELFHGIVKFAQVSSAWMLSDQDARRRRPLVQGVPSVIFLCFDHLQRRLADRPGTKIDGSTKRAIFVRILHHSKVRQGTFDLRSLRELDPGIHQCMFELSN